MPVTVNSSPPAAAPVPGRTDLTSRRSMVRLRGPRSTWRTSPASTRSGEGPRWWRARLQRGRRLPTGHGHGRRARVEASMPAGLASAGWMIAWRPSAQRTTCSRPGPIAADGCRDHAGGGRREHLVVVVALPADRQRRPVGVQQPFGPQVPGPAGVRGQRLGSIGRPGRVLLTGCGSKRRGGRSDGSGLRCCGGYLTGCVQLQETVAVAADDGRFRGRAGRDEADFPDAAGTGAQRLRVLLRAGLPAGGGWPDLMAPGMTRHADFVVTDGCGRDILGVIRCVLATAGSHVLPGRMACPGTALLLLCGKGFADAPSGRCPAAVPGRATAAPGESRAAVSVAVSLWPRRRFRAVRGPVWRLVPGRGCSPRRCREHQRTRAPRRRGPGRWPGCGWPAGWRSR